MDVPTTKYIHYLLIGSSPIKKKKKIVSSLSSPFINFYCGNCQSNQEKKKKKDGKKREASDNNSNERAPGDREDNLS